MKKTKVSIEKLELEKPQISIDVNAALIIELEDKGQDFLEFQVDKDGIILKAIPYQTEIWKGAYIPLTSVKVGKVLPIHKPPYINFGFLKYKVKSVKTT